MTLPNFMDSPRPIQSSSEINLMELEWWQKYADLENKYCWVQTPAIQQFLRGAYVRQMVSCCKPGGRIIELGCGVGWLSLLLARTGGSEVVGVDFSPAQIEIARSTTRQMGITRVTFRVATSNELRSSDERFDMVVMHAFLHHLSTSEINEAIVTARHLIAPGGRLFILEPVMYPDSGSVNENKLLARLNRMQSWFMRGQRFGLRRLVRDEQVVRDMIRARVVGIPPFGPSPKEIPFMAHEIPSLIKGHFAIKSRRRVLSISHIIAQELLVTQISHPILSRLARWPVLWLARHWERKLLRMDPPPPGRWFFELFECDPIPATQ